MHRRALHVARRNHQIEPPGFEFFLWDDRRFSAPEHIQQLGIRQVGRQFFDLFDRLRCLDKGHIRTRFHIFVHPLDSAVIPFDRQRIRTRDNDEIRVGLIFLDGPNLGCQFFRRHDGLAVEMAAPFGENLIFDVKTRNTRAFKPFQSVQRIQRVAISGIEIRNHGKIDRVYDLLETFGDLYRVDQPHIGYARAPRNAATRGVEKTGTGRLRNACRQTVIDTWNQDRFAGSDHLSQFRRLAHGALLERNSCGLPSAGRPLI